MPRCGGARCGRWRGSRTPPRSTRSGEVAVRRARAYFLLRAAPAAARVTLARALGDGDAEVRALAARALGALAGGPPVADLERAAREDPDWRVRVEAIKVLAAAAAKE